MIKNTFHITLSYLRILVGSAHLKGTCAEHHWYKMQWNGIVRAESLCVQLSKGVASKPYSTILSPAILQVKKQGEKKYRQQKALALSQEYNAKSCTGKSLIKKD